jgi:Ger(x)C family germination protein
MTSELTNKLKRFLNLFILLLGLILISGCFDSEDIDRRMIASHVGIDIAPKGKMQVTLRFPMVKQLEQPEAAKERDYILRTTATNGIFPAIIDIQNLEEHDLFIGQCRAIVFGETYARQGVKPALDFLFRIPSVPTTAYLVVARPSAVQLLDIDWSEKLNDQNIPMFFSNRKNQKYAIKLWNLFQNTHSPLEDPIIPLVTPSDDNTAMKITGMAIFQKDRMVGEIGPEESNLMTLMKSPTHASRIFIPVAKPIAMGFEVTGKKWLKTLYMDNHPAFYFKLKLNAYLTELGNYQTPLTNSEVRRIQKVSEHYLQTKIVALLKKLQSLQSDPLEMGNTFRVQQPNHFSLRKWSRDYRQAEFHVSVKLFIERMGVLK